MKFRNATMEDASLLFYWRNDPETRQNSNNSRVITFPEHLLWLRASLDNPNRQLMIAEVNMRPVGTIRADSNSDGIELSWTVAPICRNQGVGKQMVMQFAATISGLVYANIKETNLASIRIAQATKMQLQYIQDGLMRWEQHG